MVHTRTVNIYVPHLAHERGESFHMNEPPPIWKPLIRRNLCINMICHETMQIKVRIASKEPRNISLILSIPRNVMNMISVLFGPKNIAFTNTLTQKYRTFSYVHVLCAPWGLVLERPFALISFRYLQSRQVDVVLSAVFIFSGRYVICLSVSRNSSRICMN